MDMNLDSHNVFVISSRPVMLALKCLKMFNYFKMCWFDLVTLSKFFDQGLTRVSDAANRGAVSGRSGTILPSGVASCRRHADTAGLRVVLRLRMEMRL